MGDTMGVGSSVHNVEKVKSSAKNSSNEKMNVYIWDMDETLILLKSLLNGAYAETFNGLKDVQKGVEIGKLWEKLILQVCDDYFFYEQIENCNTPFLDALSQYDDGRDLSNYNFNQDGFSPPHDDINKRKLSYRHRVIAQKYKKGMHGIFDQDMTKYWDDLYDVTDNYTDQWLSSARSCLEQCSGGVNEVVPDTDSADGICESPTKSHHINVLVTSGSLIPSLVKCLLYRLDDLITYENGLRVIYWACCINWRRKACDLMCRELLLFLKQKWSFHELWRTEASVQLMGSGKAPVFFLDQGAIQRPKRPVLRDRGRMGRVRCGTSHEMAICENRRATKQFSQVSRPHIDNTGPLFLRCIWKFRCPK
ncbi:eyes absent homolog isoform X3 [Actinidia eriantha]|nr:eyes absent homolog isoform X3 [Actinidia eriantha]